MVQHNERGDNDSSVDRPDSGQDLPVKQTSNDAVERQQPTGSGGTQRQPQATTTKASIPKRSAFLRAVGLDAINGLWTGLRSSAVLPEPRKQVFQQSLWIAIERCGIHLLPCAASIIIIFFNLKGYFIGFELAGIPNRTTSDLALLQIAAKIQELLIVASVAAVLFQKLRDDLTKGRGVPFGL